MRKRLSRREFLLSAAVAAGAGLAACAPRVITEEVVVEKTVEVPVEVLVVETVEVASDPLVVEKLVEVEVVRVAGEPVWTPPDLSGQEYLIWGLQYDPHVETYERLAAKFEEHTGAKGTVEPLGWPIENHIITGMAAGRVADVVCLLGKLLLPLIAEDAVLAIDELVYDSVGCDTDTWFGQGGFQAYEFFGKVWGVPTEGNAVSGIVNARLDFLKEAGVEDMWPPNVGKNGFRDFPEMWALAEALQQVGDDGIVTRWGMSSERWDNRHLFGIMRTLGQDWWDPGSRTFHLDSDQAVEAMNFLAYRPIWELGIETHLEGGAADLLRAGQVGLACGNVTEPGTSAAEGIASDNAIYPSAIPGREALFVGEGGWGFSVPTQAANKEIGIEFLKFMTTYEGQKEYSKIYGGHVPACLPVGDDEELFPSGTLIGDAMRRAVLAQERTVYYGSGFGNPGEMEEITSAAVTEVRIGAATAEEALGKAQGLLEEMLVRYDAEYS